MVEALDEGAGGKGSRKSAFFYIVLNDGQIHVCKGKIALVRCMKDLDPAKIKKIIKGYELRLVPKTTVHVEF